MRSFKSSFYCPYSSITLFRISTHVFSAFIFCSSEEFASKIVGKCSWRCAYSGRVSPVRAKTVHKLPYAVLSFDLTDEEPDFCEIVDMVFGRPKEVWMWTGLNKLLNNNVEGLKELFVHLEMKEVVLLIGW